MRQERYKDADDRWAWRNVQEDQDVKAEAEKIEAKLEEAKAPDAPAPEVKPAKKKK